MKKNIITILILIFLSSIAIGMGEPPKEPVVKPRTKNQKQELLITLQYLNQIRKNPSNYSKPIGVDLSGVKSQPALRWNEKLARSAQKKAEDMAQNNYFDHVSPRGIGANYLAHQEGYVLPEFWKAATEKSANYIESISAGLVRGVLHIDNLIKDEGTNPPGHRIHLLGMKTFYAEHTNIGIGFAYNPRSTYQYYFVIHTAPPEGKTY